MVLPSEASNKLLAEHFNWTPLAFVDDVINTSNEIIYMAVEAVNDFLVRASPNQLGFILPPGKFRDTDGDGAEILTQEENAELQNGIHQLETLMECAVDRNMDAYEIWTLRNVLVIDPGLVPWVRLRHHEGIDFSEETLHKEGERSLGEPQEPPAHRFQKQLVETREQLLASHHLNQNLKLQTNTNERILSQLRALAALTSAPQPGRDINQYSLLAGGKETKDAAAFAGSQIATIREFVQNLKPQYEMLQDTLEASQNGALHGDEERKVYFEKMTRRHLERNRGLRLGPQGELLNNGEVQPMQKDSEEVQRLEELVGKIGKD